MCETVTEKNNGTLIHVNCNVTSEINTLTLSLHNVLRTRHGMTYLIYFFVKNPVLSDLVILCILGL